MTFTKDDSPYIATNVLSYGFTLDEEENFRELRNTFWVNRIENFHSEKFIEYRRLEKCGKRSNSEHGFYAHSKPDRFFLKYYYETDSGY